jgi:sensor histidine kinase YesM
MKSLLKSHVIIKSQIFVWIGVLIFLWPILDLLQKAVQFPLGFHVNRQALLMVLTAILSYYGSSFAIKRLSRKKLKWVLYTIAIIIGGCATYKIFWGEKLSVIYQLVWNLHLDIFLFFSFLGTMVQFQLQANNKSNEVRLELSKAQLALLRSQINPHFLYNTLHNIDALIVEKPEKASQSVIMLSDIMRYMMQDVQSEYVKLTDEIEYLTNYVALERLRLKNDKFVHIQVNGLFEGLYIAPMLMIPFVENAFKHAVDSDRENGINIQLSMQDNTFNFVCQNSYDPMETEKDTTHGIGLETVKKRLELLYHNAHQLTIHKEDTVFNVHLKVNLNAH